MPKGGSGWQWQHVCIDGQDLQVRATCNGSAAWVEYYSQQQGGNRACYPDPNSHGVPMPAPGIYDPNYIDTPETEHFYDPYVYTLGSLTITNYPGPCDEATLKAWATNPATFAQKH